MYLICKADDHEYFRNSFSARQTAVQQCKTDRSAKQTVLKVGKQCKSDNQARKTAVQVRQQCKADSSARQITM